MVIRVMNVYQIIITIPLLKGEVLNDLKSHRKLGATATEILINDFSIKKLIIINIVTDIYIFKYARLL